MSAKRRGSGSTCSAFGCTMRRSTNLLSEVKMFSFPKDPVRRAAWGNALHRKGWTPNDNSLICNAHFVTGRPSLDPQHPDYIPSKFSFSHTTSVDQGQKKLLRYKRTLKRKRYDSPPQISCRDNASRQASDDNSSSNTSHSSNNKRNVEVQTDITMNELRRLEMKSESLEQHNNMLIKSASHTETYDLVVNNSKKRFKFYTGLESVSIFNAILTLMLTIWKPTVKVALEPREQLLLVLMKLRLGLLNQDLATRFQIGVGTVSYIFHEWLDVMFLCLKRLIHWPSRTDLKHDIPPCFKTAALSSVKCIIDCTELFIQKPHNFKARAQAYSNYKHHNTVKFLVGITPAGVICFLSKVWGGRVSDRYLTIKSGFLELINKNDVILADRGFRLSDLFTEKNATLLIPASTKNKKQLSVKDVRDSRNMSRVRVHVERSIRKIKTYKILSSNIPISLLKINDEEFSTIDKIVSVVCAMCNLSMPIIKS